MSILHRWSPEFGFSLHCHHPSPDVDPETYGDAEAEAGEEGVWETLYRYAPEAKALAAKHKVKMWSLQCLGQVDSWPAGSRREIRGREKAVHWLELCSRLGLEFCQVGLGPHIVIIFGWCSPLTSP